MDFAPHFEKYRNRDLSILKADYDSIEVSDPPKDLSHTTTMELDEVEAIVEEAKLPKSLVKVADEEPVRLFTSVAKKHKLEPLEQEARAVSEDWNTIAFYFKDKFKRRRPSEILKEHDKEFPVNRTSSSESPSYPSGHSMQGYGLAEFYKEKYPYLSDEWDNIADILAHSRLQLGVHFPSDNKASKSIVDQVVGQQKESSERLRTTIFGVDPEGKLLHGFGGQGFYKFPGGGVDAGESITDAAKRELLEEAGYSVDSIEELPGLDTADSVGAGSAKGHMGHGSSLTKYLLARLGKRDESLLGSEGDAISNLQTASIDEVLQGLEGDMLFGSGVAESNHAALTKLKGMLNKTAADSHVETRRKQRAKYLDPNELKEYEARVKRTKDLPDGANYITLPHGRKAVVRTDGGKSHVATILGPAMRPPGRDISSLLIKASGFSKELFLKEARAQVIRRINRLTSMRKGLANNPRRKVKLKSPSQPTLEPTAQSPVNTQPTTAGKPNQPGYLNPITVVGGVGAGTLGLHSFNKPKAKNPNIFGNKYSHYKQANDLSVLTAVPTQNLDLIMRKGLYSQKAMLEDPEVMAAFLAQRNADKAWKDGEQYDEKRFREQYDKRIELMEGRDDPVAGPSVFFTEPDPDKVSDPRHFINKFDTQKLRVNLAKLLQDIPETRIQGAELNPFPDNAMSMSDEEWAEVAKQRQRDLSPEEVAKYIGTDPKELWKHYPETAIGKQYAANVPHAFIRTPSGIIPPEYLEQVEKTSSAKEDLKQILTTGRSGINVKDALLTKVALYTAMRKGLGRAASNLTRSVSRGSKAVKPRVPNRPVEIPQNAEYYQVLEPSNNPMYGGLSDRSMGTIQRNFEAANTNLQALPNQGATFKRPPAYKQVIDVATDPLGYTMGSLPKRTVSAVTADLNNARQAVSDAGHIYTTGAKVIDNPAMAEAIGGAVEIGTAAASIPMFNPGRYVKRVSKLNKLPNKTREMSELNEMSGASFGIGKDVRYANRTEGLQKLPASEYAAGEQAVTSPGLLETAYLDRAVNSDVLVRNIENTNLFSQRLRRVHDTIRRDIPVSSRVGSDFDKVRKTITGTHLEKTYSNLFEMLPYQGAETRKAFIDQALKHQNPVIRQRAAAAQRAFQQNLPASEYYSAMGRTRVEGGNYPLSEIESFSDQVRARIQGQSKTSSSKEQLKHILLKTGAYKDYRPRGTLYLLDGKGGVMADKPTESYGSIAPYHFPGGGIFEEEKVDRLPTAQEVTEGIEREALEELGTKLKNVRVLQDQPVNIDMPDWWRERQRKKRGLDYKGIAEFYAAAERGDLDKSIYGADNDEFQGTYYPIEEVAKAIEDSVKPGDEHYDMSTGQARLLRSLLEKTSEAKTLYHGSPLDLEELELRVPPNHEAYGVPGEPGVYAVDNPIAAALYALARNKSKGSWGVTKDNRLLMKDYKQLNPEGYVYELDSSDNTPPPEDHPALGYTVRDPNIKSKRKITAEDFADYIDKVQTKEQFLEALENSKTAKEQPLLRHRSTLLVRDPETGKLLAAKETDPSSKASPFFFPGGGLYDDEYDTPRTPSDEDIIEGARREALEELGIELDNPRVVGSYGQELEDWWKEKTLNNRGVPYLGGHEHYVLADRGKEDRSLYNIEGDAFEQGDYYEPKEIVEALSRVAKGDSTFAPFNREQVRAIKDNLLKKNASDLSDLENEFQPDLTPDALKSLGVYDQVYGDAPSEASMKEWPEHWINKQDPLGWLQWYDRYSGGRRTDDDDRQMKRWKSFKARHLAQYLKKPTPRRAAALRNWGIDVEKYS